MSVDKVILRSILSTLAAIATLLAVMLLSLIAFFPSTMMEISYDMGMEASSIRYAERAYKNSKDIYFIAYATEVAIEDGQEKKILSCGEKYVHHADFVLYCNETGKTEEYKHFIYGQVCLSKYGAGDTDGAIELAKTSLNGGFAEGNAMTALVVRAFEKQDVAAQEKLRVALEGLSVSGEDEAYLNKVKYLFNETN